MYEEFTENAVNVSRFLYTSPNANTRYKVVPLNVGVPAPMRGPGEATGSFALESALDELSYKLGIDPIELRLRNYTDMDPEQKPALVKQVPEGMLSAGIGADWLG